LLISTEYPASIPERPGTHPDHEFGTRQCGTGYQPVNFAGLGAPEPVAHIARMGSQCSTGSER